MLNGSVKDVPTARPVAVRSAPISPAIISGLVGLTDGILVFVCGFLVFLAYVGWGGNKQFVYLAALSISTVATVTAFYVANLYDFDSITRPTQRIGRIVFTCCVVFLVLVALTFGFKISTQFSRVWAFSWFVSATLSICIARTWLYLLLRKQAQNGRLTRNVVIVGGGEQAKRLISQVEKSDEPWNVIVGVFDDRAERVGDEVMGYQVLGNVGNLLSYARENRVDDVVVALPWHADNRLCDIISRLKELPVHVRLGADLVGFMYPGRNYSSLGGVAMLDVAYKPLSGWKLVAKDLEDLILSILLIVLLAPFMLLMALAIKLESKGPALFRQQRYGFNNQVFSVLKFRTMYHDRPPDEGVPQATRDDPRVTRIGKLLRRTSLDELPQLFNVFQGTMSLVGPRPHAVEHNQYYAALVGGYFARHRVKPGLTGWAQVHGLRGETETPEKMKARVKYDMDYIENWSLLLDLQIVVMTAYIVLRGDNAY
ncbi:MAG: undecaprenyl-phosphate glucose phosphotransferase [Gammaproteobacteria bacterium]|nr:undecaprenyl-phosphate glucose phosphotransferase [Gammaproteobacteria bacterium]